MPVLVVQQGHCHRTTGATGTTGEQGYAVAVASACVRLLNGRGGWVVNPTLADENDYRGDAFVAIHCDGSTSPTARGASIGYRTPEGQQFGQAWKRAYHARGWTGGFRQDNYTSALAGYYGTGNAVAAGNRRAVIVECGFRTNPEDRALLDGPGGPERVALAIGDALGIPVTPSEEELQADERNALLSIYNALFKNNKGETEHATQGDQSIISRLVELQVSTRALVGRPAADVDELALAAALAPLLPDMVRDLSDDDLQRIATAVADENARRQAA